jgi:hypothetical protein
MKYRCKYAAKLTPKRSQIVWLTGFFEWKEGNYYLQDLYCNSEGQMIVPGIT